MIDQYTLPNDALRRSIALDRIYKIIALGDIVVLLALLVLLLELGGWRWLRDRTERLPPRLRGLAFFTAFVAVLCLQPLPFSVWAHRVSLSYGLSVQGWPSWWGDRAKSLGLALAFAVPLLVGARWLVRRTGKRAWLWISAVAVPVVLAVTFASPYVVAPLFDEFEPLAAHHEALVRKLAVVIGRSGEAIPPSRMFLMKASAKHTSLNAYVTGFGASKRVVVWDTTADRRPDDEVLFIFGHELGHYALGHIVRGVLVASLSICVSLFVGQLIVARLLQRRRYALTGLDDPAAFGLYAVVFTVLGLLGEPAGNALSRRQEHAADVYGQEIIHGFVPDPAQTAARTFQALGKLDLDLPDPSPWWVWWSYGHPSISERVRFAAQYDPWQHGSPRYFAR